MKVFSRLKLSLCICMASSALSGCGVHDVYSEFEATAGSAVLVVQKLLADSATLPLVEQYSFINQRLARLAVGMNSDMHEGETCQDGFGKQGYKHDMQCLPVAGIRGLEGRVAESLHARLVKHDQFVVAGILNGDPAVVGLTEDIPELAGALEAHALTEAAALASTSLASTSQNGYFLRRYGRVLSDGDKTIADTDKAVQLLKRAWLAGAPEAPTVLTSINYTGHNLADASLWHLRDIKNEHGAPGGYLHCVKDWRKTLTDAKIEYAAIETLAHNRLVLHVAGPRFALTTLSALQHGGVH